MTTNMIFDPNSLIQQVNSLPAAWQQYVIEGVVLLMMLGRLLSSPANPVTALKSIFMGSIHSAAASQDTAAALRLAQTSIVAPPTAPPAAPKP